MIKFKEKIGYGFGDMASSMFWKLFGSYLMIFYTDVFGLSATVVGTMFLVTRIWDSAFDPIVGVIADRTHSRWGKFRPYLLYLAVPFAIIGVLTFMTPYAYFTYSLMMMVYSAINVPYASLLGVISSDPKERNILSTYRMTFAYIGSFIALLLFMPMVNYFSEGYNAQRGWTMSVVVIALICAVLFYGCFAWTKERVKSIRYFIIEENYTTASFLGISFVLSGLYLAVGQAANIGGVILAAPISNRIGKRATYMWAMAIATIFSVLFYWLDRENILMIFVFQIIISVCAGSIFPLLWSMYADCADYSELKTGNRATGLIFSSSSMSQKFGWAIGSAITGWLLSYFGFQANMVQNQATLHGIKLFLSFLPAIGTVLSIIFISMYPLSEKKMEEITINLKQKRNL